MFDYEYDKNATIKELGIEESTEGFKAQVLARIDQLIDERMLTEVEAVLSDEQVAAFNEINNREAAQAFLKEQLPNFDAMCEAALNDIVDDLGTTLKQES